MADDEQKNKGGRPLKFNSPEELQKGIDGYFEECNSHTKTVITKEGNPVEISDPQIPTIAGLAYHIGTDRHTVYNYEERDEFFHIIKIARNFILSKIEGGMVNSTGNNGGKIFIAKNYGYSDKQEIEFTKPLDVKITDYRGQ